jgi:hypothetical protein
MWRILWRRSRQPSGIRKRARFCPRIEVLEGRCLPSTLTVLNTADSGPGSLRAEIAAASSGDTIVFDPSIFGRQINLTTGELAIDTSLTISAAPSNVSISANLVSRAFDITSNSASVALDNLEIFDGAAQHGQGIRNVGSLTLDGCFIGGNGGLGVLQSKIEGGAINNFGTMFINNSLLDSNFAYKGGAIANNGTMTITNSTFHNDIAHEGGGIYNQGTLTVSNSDFLSDAALQTYNEPGSGGAIVNSGSATITGSRFGTGAGSGGAIYNTGSMTISSSSFSLCAASNAILSNGTFNGDGGGIYNTGTLTVSASTITGNSASSAGGGIYNTGTLYLINGSSVTGNTAPAGADLFNLGMVQISSDSTVGVIGP